MWKEFKAFISRGNLVELATAVVVAGAFGAIVTSLTDDIIMPPVGLLLGDVNFSELQYVLKPAVLNADGTVAEAAVAIRYGIFIQRIIDFLIIAFAIFMIIRGYNRMIESFKKEEEAAAPPAPAGPTQEELLMEIRDLLKAQQQK
ncbi:MAG: large-conductance mechanosensitive channel protein MscL [Saprospiraceae bacterium]